MHSVQLETNFIRFYGNSNTLVPPHKYRAACSFNYFYIKINFLINVLYYINFIYTYFCKARLMDHNISR